MVHCSEAKPRWQSWYFVELICEDEQKINKILE